MANTRIMGVRIGDSVGISLRSPNACLVSTKTGPHIALRSSSLRNTGKFILSTYSTLDIANGQQVRMTLAYP